MTDNTDARDDGPVKPQVIELDAADVTEVKSDEPRPEAPKAPPPNPQRRSSMLRWVIPVLIAGAVGGGWLYRGVLSSYLPTSETEALRNQIGALEANDKSIQERLNAMVGAIDAVNASSANLEEAVKAAQASAATAAKTIEGVDARMAATEAAMAALKNDLETLRNTVSIGGTGGGNVDSAALAALGQRLDALEKDVASLKSSTPAPGDTSQSAALSQALADLKAKVAAGASFQEEFDRIARMVPAAPGLDILAQHAAMGLPAAAGLAGELAALVPTLPAPEAPAAQTDDSYWDMFWDGLTAIISVRDIGETDWRKLAEESAGLAAAGDLKGAIARIDDAEGVKPSGLNQWRDRAAARLKLESAVEETAAAVLRQITALGGTP